MFEETLVKELKKDFNITSRKYDKSIKILIKKYIFHEITKESLVEKLKGFSKESSVKMYKQKEIEEMAKIIDINCGECHSCKYNKIITDINCGCLLQAEALYNAGYRKKIKE